MTDLYVYVFASRNKDNKDLENFKQRTLSFVSDKPLEQVKQEFDLFAEQGLDGEMSRLYMSLNPRRNKETLVALVQNLVEKLSTDFHMTSHKLSNLLVSEASKAPAKTNKWLFDFDYDSEQLLNEFVVDVKQYETEDKPLEVTTNKTPNGYAVVTSRGFDTRDLLAKWTNVENKRDGQLLVTWKRKGEA